MDLAKLLSQLEENEFSAPLLKYLTQRNAMPEIELDSPPAPYQHAGGLYRHGMPWQKPKVWVKPIQDSALETLVHELTHAADPEMKKQYGEGRNPQFEDAYEKLMKDKGRERLAHHMSPEFMQWPEAQRYYGTNAELGGHAMGDTMSKFGYGTPDHLGPTIATEMQILLDLAMRKRK